MASVAAAARPDVILRDMVVFRSWELQCWDGPLGERFKRFFRHPSRSGDNGRNGANQRE
jgi:hypothetical protein